MKPIKFPESNCTYAEHQPEYIPLPVYKSENGECISCWSLSLTERVKLLITGKMWWRQLTFNGPLQPICPFIDYPFVTK